MFKGNDYQEASPLSSRRQKDPNRPITYDIEGLVSPLIEGSLIQRRMDVCEACPVTSKVIRHHVDCVDQAGSKFKVVVNTRKKSVASWGLFN